MVRAREVVLPWVHVWSTMMSDRFRSVHFTRRSSCYAAATKPDLTCLSERVFKRDDTHHKAHGSTVSRDSSTVRWRKGGFPIGENTVYNLSISRPRGLVRHPRSHKGQGTSAHVVVKHM